MNSYFLYNLTSQIDQIFLSKGHIFLPWTHFHNPPPPPAHPPLPPYPHPLPPYPHPVLLNKVLGRYTVFSMSVILSVILLYIFTSLCLFWELGSCGVGGWVGGGVYCFQPVGHSFHQQLRFLLCNFTSLWYCSNFHHTLTIRQCTCYWKIGTEGSVLQELCLFDAEKKNTFWQNDRVFNIAVLRQLYLVSDG